GSTCVGFTLVPDRALDAVGQQRVDHAVVEAGRGMRMLRAHGSAGTAGPLVARFVAIVFLPLTNRLFMLTAALGIDRRRLVVALERGRCDIAAGQRLARGPGLSWRAAPTAVDQADGDVQLLVQVTTKEVPHR